MSDILIGPSKPAIPHGVRLRSCSRYPWPRIVQRLPLLHRLHHLDHRPLLRTPGRPDVPGLGKGCSRYKPLLPKLLRAVDRWSDEWAGGFHSYMDIVLRSCAGLIKPCSLPVSASCFWCHGVYGNRIGKGQRKRLADILAFCMA